MLSHDSLQRSNYSFSIISVYYSTCQHIYVYPCSMKCYITCDHVIISKKHPNMHNSLSIFVLYLSVFTSVHGVTWCTTICTCILWPCQIYMFYLYLVLSLYFVFRTDVDTVTWDTWTEQTTHHIISTLYHYLLTNSKQSWNTVPQNG